jgi:hypothetical protein
MLPVSSHDTVARRILRTHDQLGAHVRHFPHSLRI